MVFDLIQLTFDKYDELCEELEALPYHSSGWWPSPDEIREKIRCNASSVKENFEFFLWLLETNLPPETKEEEESKRFINKLLTKNLNLKEPDNE